MKNRFIFLSLIFAGLAGLTTGVNAYWVDENGYRHEGVVGGSVDVADGAVIGTGAAIDGLFGGGRRYYYDGPSDHYCRHHPYDRAC